MRGTRGDDKHLYLVTKHRETGLLMRASGPPWLAPGRCRAPLNGAASPLMTAKGRLRMRKPAKGDRSCVGSAR